MPTHKMHMAIANRVNEYLKLDDDNLVCQALNLIVNASDNINVIATGNNGHDAVNLYKIHKPDVILMDIRMGEFTGLDAAEEILKYTVRYGTLKTANLIKPDVAGAYGIVKYISNIKHSKNIGSRIQLIEEQTFLDNVLQSVKSLFGSKSKKIK